MSDTEEPGNKKEIELNEAFERLERQVAENNSEDVSKSTSQSTSQSTPQSSTSRRAKQKVTAAGSSRENTSARSSGGVISWLALLFGLVALGLASYSAFMQWQKSQVEESLAAEEQALTGEIAQFREQLDRVQRKQASDLKQVQGEVQGLLGQQTAAADAVEQRVADSVAELRRQIGTTSEDWLLAEAEYLLRLANQRVAMEDDVSGAIGLFESADKIIREAEGIVAFKLREAIAKDIAALRAVSGADVDGIFVQIGALGDQIPMLRQKQLEFAQPPVPSGPDNDELTLTQRMMAFGARLGAYMTNLVDYRSGEEPIIPLLPPGEEYYLRQNLALKLQLAQLGLLRGNQAIYQQSLDDAVVAIRQNFDPDATLTVSMTSTLEQLGTLQIAVELPDVSSSLRELRKLMAQFHETEQRSSP